MPSISKMVAGLEQSGIRKIMNVAVTMPDVIRLEVGEPCFKTPGHIIEAAHQAGLAGYTGYTASAGTLTLREIIAEKTGKEYGVALTPGNVIVTVGAVGAISSTIRAIVDDGDEVLVPDPGWPNYNMMVKCANAVPQSYPLLPENDFLPDPVDIERRIGPRTRGLIVNSPSNPLGTVFPPDLVAEIVRLVRRHDLFLISDEVYDKIVFEGRHASVLNHGITDGAIVVFSASKTYAMTGWRVGYAIGSEAFVAQLAKLQEAYVSCAPNISQKAVEAALTGPQECVESMKVTYQENVVVAKRLLDDARIKYANPKGAFYLWVHVPGRDSDEFAQSLLHERRVAVAPGSTFGKSGREYIRISLASPRQSVEEGLRRIISCMKSA